MNYIKKLKYMSGEWRLMKVKYFVFATGLIIVVLMVAGLIYKNTYEYKYRL